MLERSTVAAAVSGGCFRCASGPLRSHRRRRRITRRDARNPKELRDETQGTENFLPAEFWSFGGAQPRLGRRRRRIHIFRRSRRRRRARFFHRNAGTHEIEKRRLLHLRVQNASRRRIGKGGETERRLRILLERRHCRRLYLPDNRIFVRQREPFLFRRAAVRPPRNGFCMEGVL